MPHRSPRQRSWRLLLAALAACLTTISPAPRTGAAGAGLVASPSALTFTLAQGQQASQTTTLSNPSPAPVTLAVYEALAPADTPAHPPAPPQAARVPLPRQGARLDPRLAKQLEPARAGEFMVFLTDQADLSRAYAIRDWSARGYYVYQTLYAHAERSQQNLRAALKARGLAFEPLWAANAIRVRGTLADAQALAQRADVALLRANQIAALPPEAATSVDCSPDAPSNPVCWNIRRVGADRVWRDFGVAGQGIVVASIDTGAQFDHPALAGQYRGNRGAQGYDHNYSWFDPKQLSRAPADTNGHGTHTLGTAVGAGDSAAQPAIGVAPAARWIAAQGCAGSECTEFDLFAAAQWLLAPTTLDGADPRPDLRPMIVNNSWASQGGDTFYTGYTAAWRAAGIFPIFAAGNTGSACGSIGSPSDYADVLSIGATDLSDQAAPFSARGPTLDGRRKPDFVAPGGGPGIISAAPGGGYRALQGTSMAAPHVAGVVALLWSARPSLIGDYDATVALLRAGAQPIGDSSCGGGTPNNVYGYGRVDAYAAVQRARVDVPWLSAALEQPQIAANGSTSLRLTVDAARAPGPGFYQARVQLYANLAQPPTTVAVSLQVTAAGASGNLSGRLVSADTGAPLAGAVQVLGGPRVATGDDGRFSLILPQGSYQLELSAPSFLSARRSVVLAGSADLGTIALAPGYPQIGLDAKPITANLQFAQRATYGIAIANHGPRDLHVQARIWPDQFATFRSDEPGGPAYRWVALPNSAPAIQLGSEHYTDEVSLGFDFPFYSFTLTETIVADDGFLSFARPAGGYLAPTSGCFPDSSFSLFTIAPFRTDIDLALGGTIRYATIDHGTTFALSYENVRLAGSPAEAFSFQVLLHHDGRIVFQYRDLPRLPGLLAVGVQRTLGDYQQLGCGAGAPIHAGLAIELRPQPPASAWAALSAASATVAPGATTTISATLSWVLPRTRAQRGRIELRSDDPVRPSVTVPLWLELGEPPQRFWLPVVLRPLW